MLHSWHGKTRSAPWLRLPALEQGHLWPSWKTGVGAAGAEKMMVHPSCGEAVKTLVAFRYLPWLALWSHCDLIIWTKELVKVRRNKNSSSKYVFHWRHFFFFHSSENFFRVVGLGILQSHKMLELVLSPIFQLQKPNLWEVKWLRGRGWTLQASFSHLSPVILLVTLGDL